VRPLREADPLARDARLDLRRGRIGNDRAVVDDHDPLGKLIGLFEVMRGEQDGLALTEKLADALEKRPASLDVHPDCRLIEEDDIGITADRQRIVQALPLAAGQVADLSISLVREPGQAQGAVGGHRMRIVRAEQIDDLAHFEHVVDAGLPGA